MFIDLLFYRFLLLYRQKTELSRWMNSQIHVFILFFLFSNFPPMNKYLIDHLHLDANMFAQHKWIPESNAHAHGFRASIKYIGIVEAIFF